MFARQGASCQVNGAVQKTRLTDLRNAKVQEPAILWCTRTEPLPPNTYLPAVCRDLICSFLLQTPTPNASNMASNAGMYQHSPPRHHFCSNIRMLLLKHKVFMTLGFSLWNQTNQCSTLRNKRKWPFSSLSSFPSPHSDNPLNYKASHPRRVF